MLAAALILVIVGTLSIGSMNADLGRMGDARQRLEAGRIADLALADLEATLADGTAPEIQSEEEERDGFMVTVHVTPFDLLFADGDDSGTGSEDASAGSLGELAKEFPGLPEYLRVLYVKVEWGGAFSPKKVERTTIAFDQVAAVEALDQSATGGAGS